MLEMCVVIAMPTWPEKVADAISEVLDFPGSMRHAPEPPILECHASHAILCQTRSRT